MNSIPQPSLVESDNPRTAKDCEKIFVSRSKTFRPSKFFDPIEYWDIPKSDFGHAKLDQGFTMPDMYQRDRCESRKLIYSYGVNSKNKMILIDSEITGEI
jgi:hypothetical protein